MTFPPKVLGQVTSCGECPNYSYYSGGVHRCSLVEEAVLDKTIVAPFCPLPDYPSRTIAQMHITILGLREPLKYGFGLALMTHIAAKLKLDLHANGLGLTIPFKDMGKDREVYLGVDYIRDIEVRPFEITFTSGKSIFKLSPDSDPPLLREAADKEGKQWSHHPLAA
jgi:hypothetical protein